MIYSLNHTIPHDWTVVKLILNFFYNAIRFTQIHSELHSFLWMWGMECPVWIHSLIYLVLTRFHYINHIPNDDIMVFVTHCLSKLMIGKLRCVKQFLRHRVFLINNWTKRPAKTPRVTAYHSKQSAWQRMPWCKPITSHVEGGRGYRQLGTSLI